MHSERVAVTRNDVVDLCPISSPVPHVPKEDTMPVLPLWTSEFPYSVYNNFFFTVIPLQ